MPTYSYRCTECDNAFDIHQAFTDDTLTVCEVCGGRLRKLFNTIGVTFNGSGFYRTDSRAEGSGSKSDAAGAGSSSGGSSSGGSSSGGSSSGGTSSGGSSSGGSGGSGGSSSGGSSSGGSGSTGSGSSASVA
jgi:putative FmdB family regulatory protein